MTLRLPPELDAALTARAKRENRSKNKMAELLIAALVDADLRQGAPWTAHLGAARVPRSSVSIPRGFNSVADATAAAAQMLAAGEPLGEIWRYVILQMLDDYRSKLRHAGTDAAARMWQPAPATTSDSRLDAAFAALAEHLAGRDDWAAPEWVAEQWRVATPQWFVTELPGLHPRALEESPSSFRNRGVFITDMALERA
jgi:hypothetical protein